MPKRLSVAALLVVFAGGLALAAPGPTTSFTGGGDVLIGETFSAQISVTNAGPDTGFAPRSTLTLPDGVTFVSSDPPARTVSKDAMTGVTTVRIDYPIGSMVVGQPAVSASLTLRMETTLTVGGGPVVPGTNFGMSVSSSLFPTAALTGTPTSDGPVNLNARASAYVLSKAWTTPAGEDETPYGPSFPVGTRITLRVAPGAALTSVFIEDAIPAVFSFASFSSSYTTGMVVTSNPTVGVNAGTLRLDWPTVPAGTTITVTISGHFPHKSAGGPVLTPPGSVAVVNTANSSATFDNAGVPLVLTQSRNATINVRAITIAKTSSNSNSPLVPGSTPAHTVTYTLTVRVADSHDFSVTGVTPVVTDLFSDGQDFDATFNSNTGMRITKGAMTGTPSTFTTTVQAGSNYRTEVKVDLNQALTQESLTGGTTLVLQYRTTIPELFKDPAKGSVRAGDGISNTVSIAATGRDVITATNETYTPETSQVSQETVKATLTKEVSQVFRPGTGLLTPPVSLQVGDYVLYRLRLELPNGDADSLVITDYLPIPLFDHDNVLARGALPPGVPGGTQASFTPNAGNTADPPGSTGLSATAFFAKARIVTGQNELTFDASNISSAAGVGFVFDYSFWIPVEAQVFADDLLQVNQLSGNFSNSNGDTVSTAVGSVNVTVLAPVIEVVKGAGTSAALAEGAAHPGYDAGDEVFFRIDVKNTGNGPASNVRVSDDFPANLSFVAASAVGVGGSPAPTATPDVAGADPVVFSYATIPANTTYTFVYRALASSTTVTGTTGNAVVTNSTSTLFKSGAAGADYTAVTADRTLASRQPAVTLTLVDHDLADTPLGQGTTGEIYTYEALVTLAEGVTEDLRLRFRIPNHLGYMGDFNAATDVLPTGGGGAFQGSNLVSFARASSPTGPGTSGQDLFVVFDVGNPGGNVTTTANNDGDNGNNQFTVRLRLFSLTTQTAFPSNLNTRVRVQHDNGPNLDSAVATVRVDRPTIAIQSFAFSATSGDAGDTPGLRLVVNNTGGGRAYDGRIVVGLGEHVRSTSLPTVPGYRVTTSIALGVETLILDDDGGSNPAVLDAAGTLDVTIPCTIASTADVGSSLAVSLTTHYESYEGDDNAAAGTSPTNGYDELRDDDTSSATFSMSAPTIAGVLVPNSSSLPDLDTAGGDLTIGETADLRFDLAIPEGTLRSGVITIPLPTGLDTFDRNTSGGVTIDDLTFAGLYAATDFTLTFSGNDLVLTFQNTAIVNPGNNTADTLQITVPVLVTNNAGFSAGTSIDQGAATIGLTPGSGALTRTQPTPIDLQVVLPQVAVAKTFSPTETAGGQTVTVTLTLTPSNTATASSAFGAMVLSDDLDDPDLVYVASSATPPNADWTFSLGAGQVVTFTSTTGAKILKNAAPLVFTFQARVRDDVEAGKLIPNQGSLAVNSAPTTAPTRRTTTTTGNANLQIQAPTIRQILATTSEASSSQTPGAFSPTFAAGTAQVVPGEEVTYTYELLFPQGDTENLVFRIDVPDESELAGTGIAAYVAGSLVIDASGFGGSAGSTPSATIAGVTPTGGAAAGDDVSLNFGNLSLAVADAANNRILVTYRARVLSSANAAGNTPANPRGTVLRSDGQATIDVPLAAGGTTTATLNTNEVNVTITKPILSVTKSASPTAGDAGDTVTFTLVLRNTGDATAHQAELRDVFDARYGAPALVGALPAGFTNASSGQTFLLQGTLAGGATITVQVTSVIQVSAVSGTNLPNQATGAGSTLSGAAAQTDEETLSATSPNAPVAVNLPAAPSQAVDATSDALTPNAPGGDATRPELTPGEEITIKASLRFVEGTTQNAVYEVAHSAGFSFVSATIPAVTGISFSGTPLPPTAIAGGQRFSLGNVVRQVGAADTLRVCVVLRVNAATAAGAGQSISGSFQHQNGGPTAVGPTINPTIVRPTLTLTKALIGAASGDAGDTREFTLTVSNTGTGPARNVQLDDTVSPTTYVVTGVTDPDGVFASETFVVATGQVTFSGGVLDDGASTTVRIQVRVADTAQAGSTTPNVASGGYATAAANGQVLTIPSTPAGGSAFMMAVASLSQVSPTSAADTPGAVATIGEIVTHEFEVTLPEGTTDDVVVVAEVPPGFGFVAGSGSVVPGTFNGTLDASPVITSGGASGDDVTFDWSTRPATVTTGDNVTGNNAFRVRLQLVVLPVATGLPPTQQTLTVTGTLAHTGLTGTVAATPTAGQATLVAEPRIVVTSCAFSPTAGDAGDTLTYTSTTQNTGTSVAQDARIQVPFDGNFTVVSASLAGADASSFTNATAGNSVDFSGGAISVGGSVVLTVTVRLSAAVVANSTVNATTQSQGTSRPGDPTPIVERTSMANCTPSTAVTIGAPSIQTKALTATNNTDTTGSNLTLGELATWTFTVQLPEGRTNSLVLQDLVPAQLQFLAGSVSVQNADPDMTFLAAPTVASTGGPGDDVTITLGDVTNGVGGTNTFQVVVQTHAVAGAGVPAGATQTTITNGGQLRYSNDGGTPVSGPSATATVVEPLVSVAKTMTPATGDALTQVVMVITLTNNGTSPAYDLTVNDPLASIFTLEATPIVVAPTGWIVGSTGPTVTVTSGANSVPVGGSVEVRITCEVDASVGVPSNTTNTANASYSSSPGTPPGDRATGPVSSPSPSFAVTEPATPVQSIVSTSLSETSETPFQLNEGETVTIEACLFFPAGTTSNTSYRIDVPPGMAYVDGSVVLNVPSDFPGVGGSIGNSPPTVSPVAPYASGDDVTFSLGDVVRNGTNEKLTLRYTLRALPGILATGSVPNIGGELTFTGGTGRQATPTLQPTITEPNLVITKTASPTSGNAGDTVTYSLRVQNTGTGPAYAVTATDPIDGRLRVTAITDAPGFTESALPAGAGGTVTFSGGTVAAGAEITLTFSARVENTVVSGTTINNTATLSGLTAPSGGEASPVGGGGTSTVAYSIENPTTQKTLDVTPDPTSDPGTAANTLTIGEEITYRFKIAIPEGTTPSLVIRDQVPLGMDYVRYSVDSRTFPGTIPTPVILDDQAPSGRDVVFTFSNVVNPPDTDNTNDRFDLLVTLVVLDLASNVGTVPPGQTTLQNAGQFSFNGGGATTTGTVDVQVVEPALSVTHSLTNPGGPEVVAGETVTVTTRVQNTGTSAAHDLVSEVVIDTTQFVVPSVASLNLPAGWTLTTVAGPGANDLRIRFTLAAGSTLAPSASADLAFTVQAKQVTAQAGIASVGSAGFSSLPGAAAGERSGSVQDPQTFAIGALPPNLDTDGDGILDSDEGSAAGTDTDNDGIPDFLDLDSDGDGIPDSVEAGDTDLSTAPADQDGDGIPNYRDLDSDGDGIADSVEAGPAPATPRDTDGDGTPDYLDTDSDGDGIPDSVEVGNPASPRDTDGDGTPDYLDTDSDGDGIPDSVEAGPNPGSPVDTDGDGTPDYLDLDSDGDGIPDSVEAGQNPLNPVDTDGDGTPDYRDTDSDGDGIPDSVEAGSNPATPVDSDGDGTPDYRETDSDGDGIPDSVEAGSNPSSPRDSDGDGTPDYQDLDSDGDGISDLQEGGANPPDTDGDGTPDYLDLDSDGDGKSDRDEAGDTNLATPPLDSDGNGVPDFRQVDVPASTGVGPGARVQGSGNGCTIGELDSPDSPWLPISLLLTGLLWVRRRV